MEANGKRCGGGAEKAMTWIGNTLGGPGLIPREDMRRRLNTRRAAWREQKLNNTRNTAPRAALDDC